MRRAPFLPHCRGLQRRFASAQSQLDADVVVIGAGVVGLAIARELGLAGRQVLVLDSGPAIGTQTSSRNSEVIHSGIYYPPGSLKAQTCVEGNALMYKFCEQYNVPVRRTGKLLVATSDQQLDQLESTRRSAAANGVELERLTPGEIRELEPEVQAVAGLLAPNTGIVDSHSLMTELQRQIEEAGGMVALHSTVEGGEVGGATKRLAVRDGPPGGEAVSLTCAAVVNAAGLWAQRVSRCLLGVDPRRVPPLALVKGSYFALSGCRPPFRHLVYPVPCGGGLGVHLTLDLAGGARFGPDTCWLPPGTDPDALDYGVDPGLLPAFQAAVRAYWPGLPDGALQPGYAGVRPKVAGRGQPAGDFLVCGPEATGAPGVAALYGIESPGLTASLALGKRVAALLAGR
ncbi:hypothetical protein ACKKBF_B09645 [Auxenochlorella protothecoides x Auxenochlorella symbiontica]